MSSSLAGKPGFENVQPPSMVAATAASASAKRAADNQDILGKLRELSKQLGNTNTLSDLERKNMEAIRREGSGL